MPSKIQLDENLWFLFICLQKSDYKTIDFNAVGQATKLKPPAARMRYTRLRRQIEGGTLMGTHGTPFSGGFNKSATSLGKRKLSKYETSASKHQVRRVTEIEIKNEYDKTSDEYETDLSEYVDSEDEMPLAKRNQGRLLIENPQLFIPSPNAQNANTTSKVQSEEIPIAHPKSMFCPESATIDQDSALSVDNQLNFNLTQQLRNCHCRTIAKQAMKVAHSHKPEHWHPSIKPSTQPPHRRILVPSGISYVGMKAGTHIEMYHHKASVDIKSEEGRI